MAWMLYLSLFLHLYFMFVVHTARMRILEQVRLITLKISAGMVNLNEIKAHIQDIQSVVD